MTTPPLKKSICRSPLRLDFFLAALAVACFALMPFAQSAQSVGPEPNDGDLVGNMAEEHDAVADLGSDTEDGAVGQAATTPNNTQVMPIKIKQFLRCASGDVILGGNVVVTFKQTGPGVVQVQSIKFQSFTGKAVNGDRKLRGTEKSLKFLHYVSVDTENKEGKFGFEFSVTVPGLPASSPSRFVVTYNPNVYTWRQGKVTDVIWDKGFVGVCKRVE